MTWRRHGNDDRRSRYAHRHVPEVRAAARATTPSPAPTGDDIINGGAGNDTINGLDGNDQIWDGAGNDSVNGGDGNDSLYGDAGNDNLNGNDGDDTIIAIGGGTADQVTGGNGNDTFWIDNSVTENVTDADSTEIAEGAVHKVTSFANDVKQGTDRRRRLPTPRSPARPSSITISPTDPLFATDGPSIDDIAQGQTGDCYFLATLASIAKLDPMQIQQSIVESRRWNLRGSVLQEQRRRPMSASMRIWRPTTGARPRWPMTTLARTAACGPR